MGKGGSKDLEEHYVIFKGTEGAPASLTEYKKRKYRALNANKGDHSNTIEGLALKILLPSSRNNLWKNFTLTNSLNRSSLKDLN